MRKEAAGFTLIELMITVAIVAILSAIAYPSYQEYVLRTRRVEAMDLLGEAAARQERWRAKWRLHHHHRQSPACAWGQVGAWLLHLEHCRCRR